MQRLARYLAVVLVAALMSGSPALAQSPEPSGLPLPLRPDALLPLESTTWRLSSYLRGDTIRMPGPEVAAWMRLHGGRLVGSGGCDRLRGSYAASGSALQVDIKRVKRPSCGEQTAIVQLEMIEGLEDAASFELVAGEEPHDTALVVRDLNGTETLRFEIDDAADLEGSEWRLEAYVVAGSRSVADTSQPAVLSFRPASSAPAKRRSEGEVFFSTGCNGIVADYFRRADVLSFGVLDRTEAPCSGSAAAQEDAIVAVLDSSAIMLDLPPDRLVLTSADGDDRLELVSAAPLEATTWLLERLRQSTRPVEPVTLRLQDGALRGQGPCGSYEASYSSDGVFITVSAIDSPSREGCEERRATRRLFDAYERAVRVDRRDGKLAFVDAAGEELARFTSPSSP